MRYLVTGGCGFIGTHLVRSLLAASHEVTVLDLAPAAGVLEPHPGLIIRQGSAADPLIVDDLTRPCDVVVHLAASVGVKAIVRFPLDSLLNNLRASETVFAAAQRWQKKVFFASSSEVFGEAGPLPVDESAPHNLGPTWVPRWSYGYGKSLEEALLFSYGAQLGLETVVGRFFNPSGPGHVKGVIPAFASQALNGGPLTVFGDGDQTRCFCHVDDLIAAIVLLLEDPRAVGRAFNIGTDVPSSMNSVARLVSDAYGGVEIVHVPFEDAYDEMFRDISERACDSSALQALGWRPTKAVADIVYDIVDLTQSRHV